MSITFELVWWAFGGQMKKYQDFSVEKDDLIFVCGSCNENEINFELTGINATLLIRRGSHINQTKVWRALESGAVRVTQFGKGNNWDHIVGVVRPSETPFGGWRVLGTYTSSPAGSPKYTASVEAGTIIFIHRYASSQYQPVDDPPIITGVDYTTLVDGLPEGAAGAGNARETVIKTLSSGTITIVGPDTHWMQVNYVVPVTLGLFDEFIWV